MKNISEEQLTELRQYGIKIESEEEFQLIKNRLEKVGEVVDDPYTQCSTERPYLVFGNGINEWFFSNPSDPEGTCSSVYDTKEFITSDVFKAIYADMESEDIEEDRGNCYDDYAEMFRVDQMESGGIEK